MGGLAEYAVAPATAVFRVPPRVPLAESCIIGCAIMTAYGAVRRQANLTMSQTVAVVGVGGVGSNIIQMARTAGASMIIAVDVRDEKLEAAKALGATHGVNGSRDDPVEKVRDLTGGEGVDVAFEALGFPQTIVNAFKMAKDGGRIVVVGIAAGAATADLEITHLVRRGISVAGSYGARVRSDMPEILRLVAAGKIDVTTPISQRLPLHQINEAYDELSNGPDHWPGDSSDGPTMTTAGGRYTMRTLKSKVRVNPVIDRETWEQQRVSSGRGPWRFPRRNRKEGDPLVRPLT